MIKRHSKISSALSLAALFSRSLVSSFSLTDADKTIRATHDSNQCLFNFNDKRVKVKWCTDINDQVNTTVDTTWEHVNGTGQIRAGRSDADAEAGFSKCWTIASRKNKPDKISLKLADCDDADVRQKFDYYKGQISQDVDGLLICVKIVTNGNVRLEECEHGHFGPLTAAQKDCQGGSSSEDSEPPVSLGEDAISQSFSSDSLTVGGFTCTPSFEISCSSDAEAENGYESCQISNTLHNCEKTVIEDGLCRNKNIGGSDPLRVALWNVQILGDSKANKQGVMRTFVKVFENFDIVGISELRDSNQSGGETFFNDYLNVNGGWERAYGERDGSYKEATNTTVSPEQTIFFWRTEKVELVKHTTFTDWYDDFYVRGPQAGHFKRLDNNYEFTLVQMHLSANDAAVEQADYLIDVERVLTEGGNLVKNGHVVGPVIDESNPSELYPSAIMFGGDMNADDPYVVSSALPNLALKLDTSYTWLIADDADTNVGTTVKAYDRIILHNDMVNAVCDESYSADGTSISGYDHGILRFTDYFNLVLSEWLEEFPDDDNLAANGLDKEDRVSDHWPVWFTIY